MNTSKLLAQTQHRPWPLLDTPWVMRQKWHQLLFAHWPIPVEDLRPLIPPELEIDTYEGQAWIGVVPFRMSGIHPRYLFSVPWLSSFLELNLRTYVTRDGKAGVWFFSLDAANPVAVQLARKGFHLPYFDARMSLTHKGDFIDYRSHRTHKGAHPADLKMLYRPIGKPYKAKPYSLEHWLTERYCLYAADPKGRIYRGEIHHLPWPLQAAEAETSLNTLTLPHGLHLPSQTPILHYAHFLDVLIWPLHKCT